MEGEVTEGRSESAERPDRTFELGGERYELPLISTFNLAEEHILYVYADAVIQDLMPVDPGLPEDEKMIELARQIRRFRNPALKRAVAHIAYRRAHSDATEADIEKLLDEVNALELDIAMYAEVKPTDPPKSSQTSSSSEKSENGHSDPLSSGRRTENTSPFPALTLASTGTSASDTSFPPSDPAIPA